MCRLSQFLAQFTDGATNFAMMCLRMRLQNAQTLDDARVQHPPRAVIKTAIIAIRENLDRLSLPLFSIEYEPS